MCTPFRNSHPVQQEPNVGEPPAWRDDDRSAQYAREVVKRISELCSPVTVDRGGMHNINLFSADRLSEQRSLPPLFRRLSSMTPPIEGRAPAPSILLRPKISRGIKAHHCSICVLYRSLLEADKQFFVFLQMKSSAHSNVYKL